MSRTPTRPGDAHLPPPGEPWTPIRLTRWSGEYLRERGVENGRLDAELILAHVLGVRRLDLYLQFDRPMQDPELGAYKELLRRRAAREPLQYVLGTVAFRELDLRVDARALIPRPETEILVGEVLAWAEDRGTDLTGLDVGTGSGVIALSLLREGPFRSFVATDPSPAALELARDNAVSTGLQERIEFRAGGLFQPVNPGERFDVLVSNPPYIPEGERESLPVEVAGWEPPEALFAGQDGLSVILPLIQDGPRFLMPGGLLAVEVGADQGARVAQGMEDTGCFQRVSVCPDLAGRGRVVVGVVFP